jgi:hypothetical protein
MFSFSSPAPVSVFSRSCFAPQTPSPLRTSYNANARRMDPDSGTKSSPLNNSTTYFPTDDENVFFPNQSIIPTETPSTIHTTSSFQTPAPSTRSTKFAFESRARSSSPASQVNARVGDGREKRKSLFLDRIRNRRGGERDERMGEQVLRMDYVRERRMWEEEKNREMMLEGAEDGHEEMDVEQAELSPTEEKELDALVEYWQSQEDASVQHKQKNVDMAEGSDDEYDQLFMELTASQADEGMDLS